MLCKPSGYMSSGVSVQRVSVQGVSNWRVHVLGVSVRGVHVRGGSVLSPSPLQYLSKIFTCLSKVTLSNIRKSLVKVTFPSPLSYLNDSLTKSLSTLKAYFHAVLGNLCDNRPPSGWLRGAKPLGPFLGPLTSFPSV